MAAIGKKMTEPWTTVTENPQSGGTVTLTLPNGNVKSVNPDGNEEERPAGTSGPWEQFRKTPTAYVAEREKKGKIVSYVFPRV